MIKKPLSLICKNSSDYNGEDTSTTQNLFFKSEVYVNSIQQSVFLTFEIYILIKCYQLILTNLSDFVNITVISPITDKFLRMNSISLQNSVSHCKS